MCSDLVVSFKVTSKSNWYRHIDPEAVMYIVTYMDYKISFFKSINGWIGSVLEESAYATRPLEISGLRINDFPRWEIFNDDVIPFIQEFLDEISGMFSEEQEDYED